MSTILPEEEIDRLTKPRTQRAAQTRYLEKLLGCKLARRPDGLPLVTPEMLARLNGGAEPVPDANNGLNWGA
ncbi:hypothetical protein [Diaphorobacter caeni]|uniref:hypothetical protein n=1 Tax=Diaphorobacter caeni TaxID=2784387 RepID=UPI001890864E|nr:hypothetical protein [Diaphorobacter caeni]MBF5006302.1 hypothetical protein [Diaphorobacter caeni]